MTYQITSLPTAILSFAFSGVLGPHTRPAETAPRVVSHADRTFIQPSKG